MTDEDILIAPMIDSTVACSLKLLLIALYEERTATLAHINAIAVEIGTIDGL